MIALLALIVFAAASRALVRGCSGPVALAVLCASITCSTAATHAQDLGPVNLSAMAQRGAVVQTAADGVDLSAMRCRQLANAAVVSPPANLTAMAQRHAVAKPAAKPVAPPIAFTMHSAKWCGACPWYQDPKNFPVEKGFVMRVTDEPPPRQVQSVPSFWLGDQLVAEAPIEWRDLKPKLLAAHRRQSHPQHVSSR